MKKNKIIIAILIIFFSGISVYTLANSFSIDSTKLSLSSKNKKTDILENFNDEYNLTYSIASEDAALKEQITELSKKVTYLLLGSLENQEETYEDYYKRHQDYLALRYNPEIPPGDSFSGLDDESQEYLDDLVSGISVPGMFLTLDELGIEYNSFGDIRVSINDNMVISAVSLPNVKMKKENEENPMEYDLVERDLTLYYYFKPLNNEYKLYYLMGETSEALTEYFDEVESTEKSGTMAIMPTYDTSLQNVYDYSKLQAMTESELTNIYESNKNNILSVNSYYNNNIVASANGFFINDGLVVVTWNFIEKSLVNAQYIAVKDNNGNSYEAEGIVTANPDADIAVLKLKTKTGNRATLGNIKDVAVSDPVIAISSKTSVGLSVQTGIIVSKDGFIQNALPLTEQDEGSPLFNKAGQVIGINTAKSVNTSLSIAVNSDALKEIQDKFNNISFEDISVITFENLKEQYYYINYNEEKIQNDIPDNIWNKYSKIGNIEENIKLNLVKASYINGVVSLRYENGIADYISSMQLASTFKEKLLQDGYTEILNSNSKCIYENGKYKVVIIEEFDYLIVVMVKL